MIAKSIHGLRFNREGINMLNYSPNISIYRGSKRVYAHLAHFSTKNVDLKANKSYWSIIRF